MRSPDISMLVGPGQVHADRRGSGVADYRILRIPPRLVSAVSARMGLAAVTLSVAKHEVGAPANARFLSLHRALDQGTSSRAVDNLLADCMESVASGCVAGDFAGDLPAEMVCRAHAHLLHNLAQKVTLSDLAAATGYGKWSLIAAFRAEVGVPPIQYLMQLRAARARALLRAGRPCSDVAAEVGFFDQSHFNRSFRRTYGITPGQYQRTFAGT